MPKTPIGSIVGLGITPMGKIYGRRAIDFAAEAISLALDDAGISKAEVDGLLISANSTNNLDVRSQMILGFKDLALVNVMNAYGSTVGTMIQYACMAIEAGLAKVVVLVHADAPLTAAASAGQSYGNPNRIPMEGFAGLRANIGNFGRTPEYAMAARRHMHLFGTTSRQFGAIAVAQRSWAAMNPRAQMRQPMTIDDHQASRMIAEPLRLLDCCLVSNGAVALVVTSAERAKNTKQSPVQILSCVQAAPGDNNSSADHRGIYTGAIPAGNAAFRIAGIGRNDVSMCQIYDCYTYTVLVTLEDYGFCKKGEGGSFVEDGKLGPNGSLPTNTGGGQLSGYYMWGFTPLSEAVIQLRGQAGDRQLRKNDIALVSANGGILHFHASLILAKDGL